MKILISRWNISVHSYFILGMCNVCNGTFVNIPWTIWLRLLVVSIMFNWYLTLILPLFFSSLTKQFCHENSFTLHMDKMHHSSSAILIFIPFFLLQWTAFHFYLHTQIRNSSKNEKITLTAIKFIFYTIPLNLYTMNNIGIYHLCRKIRLSEKWFLFAVVNVFFHLKILACSVCLS